MALLLGLSACSEVSVPDSRNVKIPAPTTAEERKEAINERSDSVMYLPLGADVLVPERISGGDLPTEIVGPFELRSETLGGALQLILADYDVSISFETEEGLSRKVTVANLKGPLDQVVHRVCSLADLYCSFEDGGLVVKDTQTFTVTLPPLGDAEGSTQYITDVMQGLAAVLGTGGTAPVSDPTTRSIIYTATQRTSKLAESYFQRLRANTAMIVFETYIWEVALNSGNSAGIDWSKIEKFGKFNASIAFNGSVAADFTNPVSIGLPTTSSLGATPTQLVQFLSQFGAVKTISQPQITVLSGAKAELRVADTQNYVSEVSSTISGDNTTTSVSTDSVDSGFTLTIGSSWDRSTVYSNININLANVVQIDDFAFDTDAGGGQTTIQLPQTTERELTTQIRVRPGDSVLIGGLVRETDNFDSRGPGFMEPIIPDSRTAKTENLELVVLLRPRVIVYTAPDDARYKQFLREKLPDYISAAIPEEVMESNAPVPSNVSSDLIDPLVPLQPVEAEAISIEREVSRAPTPILPPSEMPIIDTVPTPSVAVDNMMTAPAIELMNTKKLKPLSTESYVIEKVQSDISNVKVANENEIEQAQNVARDEYKTASGLVSGYISKWIKLPERQNNR
ncbi:MAG: type II and III secretion system family protein [Alphaproteobacteria bacterium]|nr:type II and III secretion system family protein [Alphaproteobacteria bacterium]